MLNYSYVYVDRNRFFKGLKFMDLVTQGLLGATVGYAVSEKKLGHKKALGWGAFFGLLPDVDVVFKYFSTHPMAQLFYHRGITHSLFFAPVLAFFIAFYMQYKKKECYKSWFWLIFWSLITHPLLDIFTTYGTQVLQPFSNHRFSLNAVPIIDPLYSVPLLLVILLIMVSKNHVFARITNMVTLFLTSAYLLLGVAQYEIGKERILAESQKNGWCGHFEIFTGLFSIFERRAVFYEGDKIHVAHFSNVSNKKIEWVTFLQENLPVESDDIKTFRWFSKGHILVQKQTDGSYLLRDIRFGIDPHPMDGLWGILVDTAGAYINWETFSSLRITDIKIAFDKLSTFHRENIAKLVSDKLSS
ncbi:MAG: hypothetical protein NEHIOOID_00350 [Holosporales bacterium]